MSNNVKLISAVLIREYDGTGKLWWVASSSGQSAQAATLDDCMYEFERLLVGGQAVRDELEPLQYKIAYTIHQTINVLTDGEHVTGWANEDGVPIDDMNTEGR